MGDIAIDDTSFYGCIPSFRPLPTPAPSTTPKPTTTPCQANQFFCPGDAKCIPMKKRCDFVADCNDGSDEANCGMFGLNGYSLKSSTMNSFSNIHLPNGEYLWANP